MDFCNKLRNKDSSNSMKELMAKLDNLCSQLSSSCNENTEKLINSISELCTQLKTDSNDNNIEALVTKLNTLCDRLSSNNKNTVNVRGLAELQKILEQISEKLPEKEDSNTTIKVLTDEQMESYLEGIKTFLDDVLIKDDNKNLTEHVEKLVEKPQIKNCLGNIKNVYIKELIDNLNIEDLLDENLLNDKEKEKLIQKDFYKFKKNIKNLCKNNNFIQESTPLSTLKVVIENKRAYL